MGKTTTSEVRRNPSHEVNGSDGRGIDSVWTYGSQACCYTIICARSHYHSKKPTEHQLKRPASMDFPTVSYRLDAGGLAGRSWWEAALHHAANMF